MRLIERDSNIILFLVGRISVAVATALNSTFALLCGDCFVSVAMASDMFDEIERMLVRIQKHLLYRINKVKK